MLYLWGTIEYRLRNIHVNSNHQHEIQREVNNVDDRYVDMVNETFCDTLSYDNYYQDEVYQNKEETNYESIIFITCLKFLKNPLL